MSWSTSARYALSPQFTSCSRTPEITPVVQLKTRENDAPQERVVAPGLPAGDEVEALVELREELRDLGRVVLQVGVDRHDDLAARLEEAGLERRGLPEVAAQVDHDDIRQLIVQSGSTDMLPSVEPSSTKTTSNGSSRGSSAAAISPVELLERALLVEQWNDDRDHVTGGYRRPRSASSAR